MPSGAVESGVVRTAETYHILAKTEEEAKRLSTEIRSVPPAQQFSKFQDVARRASSDPGSAPAGGNLGRVYEGEMVKSFERVVFGSNVREVVGPYRSEFGWHLSYVVAFASESVSGICRPPLVSALRAAGENEKAGLTLALEPLERQELPGKVMAILDQGWRGPLMDQNRNLMLLRVNDESDQSEVRLVTQHTELLDGKLEVTARPKGCIRSERTVWAINCRKNQIAWFSSTGHEGRAAAGRVLFRTNVGASQTVFKPIGAGSFGEQLRKMVCSSTNET